MKRTATRRGLSLLEFTSTMGVVGITMMVVASVLTLSIRTYEQSLKTLATQRSVLSFERRFRDDCRNAKQVDLADGKLSLVDQRGQLIAYEFDGPRCSRKLQSNFRSNDLADRATMRWDNFSIGGIDVSNSHRRPLISLHATLNDTNEQFEIWVRADAE